MRIEDLTREQRICLQALVARMSLDDLTCVSIKNLAILTGISELKTMYKDIIGEHLNERGFIKTRDYRKVRQIRERCLAQLTVQIREKWWKNRSI